MAEQTPVYRHEWKHELSFQDSLILRQRLRAVMEPDVHAVDGKYFIRSLYFDNGNDKALWEKLDGVNRREKFRLRYYNGDPSLIHLEKKSKLDGLGTKLSANVTAEEAQKLVDGDLDWMLDSDRPLVRELYVKMRSQGLRPCPQSSGGFSSENHGQSRSRARCSPASCVGKKPRLPSEEQIYRRFGSRSPPGLPYDRAH